MEERPPSIKFYTDTHIARAVTEQLRARGVDIVRCEEVGRADASDEEHLEYATEQDRVLITHDADFLRLNQTWQEQGQAHAGIMFVQSHLQGAEYVGPIIRAVIEFHDLMVGGAGSFDEDIANRVFFIG
jgi:microsomal dipeptidase-like Zn-dependent dipeptidase